MQDGPRGGKPLDEALGEIPHGVVRAALHSDGREQLFHAGGRKAVESAW